jgi:hypothetical protein
MHLLGARAAAELLFEDLAGQVGLALHDVNHVLTEKSLVLAG